MLITAAARVMDKKCRQTDMFLCISGVGYTQNMTNNIFQRNSIKKDIHCHNIIRYAVRAGLK